VVDRCGANLLRRHVSVSFLILLSYFRARPNSDPRYVAMHTMVENSSLTESSRPMEAEYGMDGEDGLHYAGPPPRPKTKPIDVALMVVGMLLPLITQIGHAHAHGG
jgi:hypothetical protein